MPAVQSVEVAADGKVTFRLRAPAAKEVLVTGVGRQPLPMQKDDQGVWSVTTGVLESDIYDYHFQIDGVTVTDPGNPRTKPTYRGTGQSLLLVPGPNTWTPAPDLPRGAITRHFYHSAAAEDDRDYWVYTPAGYDPKRREPYPVLYLLHGMKTNYQRMNINVVSKAEPDTDRPAYLVLDSIPPSPSGGRGGR